MFSGSALGPDAKQSPLRLCGDIQKSCYKPRMHSAIQTEAGSTATGQPQKLSIADVCAIYDLPLPTLVHRAMTVHQANHDPSEVQLCSLLSVKTGGCQKTVGTVRSRQRTAAWTPKRCFLSMMCSRKRDSPKAPVRRGFAWGRLAQRQDGPAFERVLDMVRGVRGLGMEACVTLGMLTEDQARKLGDAGLTAYNHNLDTSRSFYGKVITTRTYDDRLETLQRVRRAGISLCCGGIIGMGNPSQTAARCCIRWRRWTRRPKVCRSTRLSRCRERRSKRGPKSIRWNLCGRLRPHGF